AGPPGDGYRRLLERLDRWAREVAARHPGVLPCRTGCAACCHGPFDVTVADVELVRAGVEQLPPDARLEVVRRAKALFERLRAFAPDWRPPWDIADLGDERFDAMADALAREPCPLLGDDGACRIYASRPMVCRLIGIPLRSPAGRVIENACPIQEDFPRYAALPPQPFALEEFEVLEHECMRDAAARVLGDPDRWEYETTIAAVVAGGP
ncbi:MAG TPA: YkgJ family cysteine cluster protein, partial [Gemmatimonadales bacterium]|nr:YkgJ family cysteine cluster protein [Gemmatimonadales bacterium]